MVILDEEAEEAIQYKRVKATFKGANVSLRSSTADGIERLYVVSDDRERGKYYMYNDLDGTFKYVITPFPDHA